MKAFVVTLENKPGQLAPIAELLAAKGVNLTALAALTSGDRGQVGFATDDDTGARIALGEAGIEARELEVLPLILEDQPGTFAEAAHKLADAGVNLELVMTRVVSVGRGFVLIAVDDVAGARTVLGDLVSPDPLP